jgi:hypothetical protein
MYMKIHRSKRFWAYACLFLSILWVNLYGEVYQYKITCLGIRVVDINITNNFNQDSGNLRVKADSYYTTPIFPTIHNIYITNYVDGFLPTIYEKHVNQKKYFEERVFTYDREKKTATLQDKLKNRIITYPIMPTSRDFFSALLYIASHLQDKDTIYLDANRLIWTVSYVKEDQEVIKTSIGKLPAIKLKMHFQKISSEPKENTDMLTNQLVNEENTLYLWISDDVRHLPLRAKYERKPFPVYWEIISYKK